ncbi:hypothetical protein GGR52DRAFT_576635 [Hypoxylon sp. FL1284]|nr:hypothetical protein GGR52DRAFT_576635 [Hypoxylon sp. FL1284]
MSSQTVEEVHTLFTSNDFFDEHSKIRSTWFTKYWLFKNGVAETRPVNFTMMHMAAESGYVQLVHVLVNSKYRPDVNARDGLERTPLHWAVANRYYEVARLLLENGANPNATSADQSSVLHVAIQVRQIDLVRLLLDHGVYFETEWLRGTRAEMQQLLQGYVRLKYKLPENAAVEKKFWGRVIDIGSSQRCHSKAVPVDEILDPGNSLNELMLDDRPEDLFKNERNSVRWIHLPENNMEWVEILLTKVLGTPEATANLLRSDLWRDRVRNAEKNYYKRCLRPVSTDFCNTSTNPMNPTSPGKSRIMLAIPYLHWATDTERLMLKNTIHAIRNGDNSLSKSERVIHADGNKHRELLDTYFNRDSPLHVRRTLDQFYYFNLDEEEMDIRDKDQTISKYYNTANNVNPGEVPTNTQKIHDYPVLMVDQLWLWVIDGDTVITSFPHRWANDASGIDSFNMTDVVAAIERRILSKAWPNAIKSGTDLAALIANECSGILFDPARHRDKWIQTQEIYENTIGNLANRESSIFQAFSRSINRPKDWGTEKGENERYAIKEEIDLLKDIKDIRDELNMIRTIFEAQISAVDGFVIFHHLQYLVTNRIKDVDRIDQRASRAQDALSHILDLKQKQANAEEAHFLSVQNIESGKQSRAIMTFTIVTIIWAPLSFFSSFFAIQFTDFPKLTMGFVLKYLGKCLQAYLYLPTYWD